MTTYITDAFSLDMVSKFPAKIIVDKLDKTEFCIKLENAQELGDLVTAVSEKSVADAVNKLCCDEGYDVRVEPMRRVPLKLSDGNELLVVKAVDLPKEITTEEVLRLYKEGKIEFYEVEIR